MKKLRRLKMVKASEFRSQKSCFQFITALVISLLVVSFCLVEPQVVYAQTASDMADKATDEDKKEITNATKALEKALRAWRTQLKTTGGKTRRAMRGGADAVATLLINFDSIACAMWLSNCNRILTNLSMIRYPSPQQLEVYRRLEELRDLIAKLSDKVTNPEAYEGKGGGGAMDDAAIAKGEDPDVVKPAPKPIPPPAYLSEIEKKCWPQCGHLWRAWHAASRARTEWKNEANLRKARHDSFEENVLGKARARLEEATKTLEALKKQRNALPLTGRSDRQREQIAKLENSMKEIRSHILEAENDLSLKQNILNKMNKWYEYAKKKYEDWAKEAKKRRAAYEECLKKCQEKKTSLYLGLRSSTGVPVSYAIPGIYVEGVRIEGCTLNPVNDPVVIMPQPGDVPIAIAQGPPLPVSIPDFSGPEEEEPPDTPAEPTTDKPTEEEKDETPPAPPAVYIVKTLATVLEGNKTVVKPVLSSIVKISLNPDPQLARGDDEGFDSDPLSGFTDDEGNAEIVPMALAGTLPGSGTATITLDVTPMDGKLLHMEEESDPEVALHPELIPYVRSIMNVDGENIVVLLFPRFMGSRIAEWLEASYGIVLSERDLCRIIKTTPNDPYFSSKGSWDQEFDDQWAIKRIGFTPGNDSAWNLVGDNPLDVVVAVVDTGIDWNHRDFSWDNLWKNTNEIPDNGIDDDGNGYIDDIIGWDFIRDTNRPWDRSGHGTIVAGVIAAETDNGIGIAGINPNAKIMVLKAMNNFGQTRASFVVEAILYAVNNGARIINLSMGGKSLSEAEQKAVKFANKEGVIIIAAAGNEGEDVTDMGPAGLEHVIAIAATDMKDNWPLFSNWGMKIDIAAPGVDVLSLRARRTDVMRDMPGARYTAAESYVGEDNRYYRAGGTSFSAPIVSGVASLLLSKNPDLTGEQVKRMIRHSAEDINVPGFDQFTGYGLLDARAALMADPEFFIETRIHGVKAVRKDNKVLLEITGTASADKLNKAWIEIGKGKNPETWKKVSGNIMEPVLDGVLAAIPAEEFRGAAQWKLRLVAEHTNGRTWEAGFDLKLQ